MKYLRTVIKIYWEGVVTAAMLISVISAESIISTMFTTWEATTIGSKKYYFEIQFPITCKHLIIEPFVLLIFDNNQAYRMEMAFDKLWYAW